MLLIVIKIIPLTLSLLFLAYTGHARIREKKCVRDFFCLDDPPGAHDTLEESRVSFLGLCCEMEL